MANEPGLNEASIRGRARLVTWVTDGTLVTLAEVAKAWRLELYVLEEAIRRDELFLVWVDNTAYIPSELLSLGSAQSSKICSALKNQTASSKIVFLKRAHGGLGGKSVVKALASGTSLCRICELAAASASPQ